MKIADFDFDEFDSSGDQTIVKPNATIGSIPDRFAAMVAEHPERIAVRDENDALSYDALDRDSNRIAHFIDRLDLPGTALIGVMTDRNRHYITAVLGILKAGHAFVPLDPSIPLARRLTIARDAELPLVLADTANVGDLHQLQWRSVFLKHILCIDHDDIDTVSEMPGSLMSTELWDHLAGDDADNVLAGGWKSAFTGQPIEQAAMDSFGTNARNKVAKLVSANARVLEIGCASGFTMKHVAPMVGQYVATDLSRRNVERTESLAIKSGMTHVMGRQLAAHDIDVFEAGTFDLVILNSVIENFPGFGYLRQVLDKAAKLLAPGGAIYLGNVWDADRKDAYLADLADFASKNADKGYDTRLDFLEDLFVPEAFLQDWTLERGGFVCERSSIEAPGFDPAPYTFDLVLRSDPSVAPANGHKLRHDRTTLGSQPDNSPAIESGATDLAYVLFTSGTTGTPKGVMIEHGSVVNLAQSVLDTQLKLIGADDPGAALNLTCVAPFAFDGSVVQIFAAILNGHSLHIPGFDTRTDPEALQRFITDHRIDHLDTTPSLFFLLLDYWEEAGQHCSARMVVLGGEPVSAELPERFFANADHRESKLVNAYGPTECCVSSAQYLMTAHNFRQILPPPIGKPIQGVEIDICDDKDRSLPDGIAGEIRIGGAGVARGYLNDPAQTDRKFIIRADDSRWYCSGDFGRRRPDGEIIFIGREDRQVKLRGIRLELAEIESVIAKAPLVRRVAVLLHKGEKVRNDAIVAYVVAENGFDAATCRAQLEQTLPAYMVPGHIICVDDIPLTINGKVDHTKLPAITKDNDIAAKAGPPLATDLERKVADLMAEVLDRTIDTADADFFDLGGHSVLAVQFLSKLTKATDVKVPLSDLFIHSTVRKIADRITARMQLQKAKNPVTAVNPGGTDIPLVCFHPVGGNILCYQSLARALGANQPVYMVEAQGLEEGHSMASTVQEMVAGYLPQIRESIPSGPIRVAGWSFGGLLAFEAAYRLSRMGIDVRSITLLDAIAVPDSAREMLRKDEAEYLADVFGELGIVKAEDLRPLPPEERIDYLIDRGKRSDLLPQNADRDMMRRLLAVFQNNALAAVHYVPPTVDDIDILLIRPETIVRGAPHVPNDPYNGWRGFTNDTVELVKVPGTHGTMITEPDIFAVADSMLKQFART